MSKKLMVIFYEISLIAKLPGDLRPLTKVEAITARIRSIGNIPAKWRLQAFYGSDNLVERSQYPPFINMKQMQQIQIGLRSARVLF